MAKLLNTKIDENPLGLPPDRRRGWFRSTIRGHTCGRGEFLDSLAAELDEIGMGPPRWNYDVAWFAWELLRRSDLRGSFSQDRWHWDRSFPSPSPDGSCPARHRKVGDVLRQWIEPIGGPPIVLEGGIEPRQAFPFVSATLDLRSSDEDFCRALAMFREGLGVGESKVRAPQTFWGKLLGPVEAIDFWERWKRGETLAALARELIAPDDVAARRRIPAHDSDLVARKRDLRKMFKRIDAAIRYDPWRPYYWGARYKVNGSKWLPFQWFVTGVQLPSQGRR